jgi:ABC-type glycerol-3-phosphate transport system substrate-binding protein
MTELQCRGRLSVAIVLSLLAWFCALQIAAAAPMTSSAPVRIVLFHAPGHGYERWVQAGLDKFNSGHPDIQATLVTGQPDKLLAMISAGLAPDIIHGPGDRFIPMWAYQDIIQPLDAYVAADRDVNLRDFVPSLFQVLSWRGELYGLPRNWSVGGIVHNVVLLANRGISVPDEAWTWEDLISQARKLTFDASGDGEIDTYGFHGTYTSSHRFPPWLWGAGGGIWNETMTKSRLDSPESLTGLRFMERIFFTEPISPLHFSDRTGVTGLLQQGRLGMTHQLRQSIGFVAADRRDPTFEAVITPLPVGPGGKEQRTHIAVLDYLTMYKYTPAPGATWQVLKFLVSDEGMNAGMDLAPKMAYQEMLPSRLGHLRRVLDASRMERNPYAWTELATSMRGSDVTHPVFGTEIIKLWTIEMAKVLRREVPIEEAGKELARQLNVRVEQSIEAGHKWW